jgi:glycosyltransferase involved in cell wall biosynthesis
MAGRLAAHGNHVTVLTTSAREVSDFWRPSVLEAPALPAHEVMDGVMVERLQLTYPWPPPYVFGLLRRAGLWLHLSRLPSRLVGPIQQCLSRWMPPLRGLSSAMQRWAPEVDLIHADDGSWDGLLVAAATAARHHKKPLVIRPLMHLGSALVRSHYQMAHQVSVYRDAAAILALSQPEAAAFVALGVLPERIHIIRMGVEPEIPESLEALDTLAFRRQHALSGPVVAFVGANTYDKGAFALSKAVIQLNLEGLLVNLVCVGPQGETLKTFLQQQTSRDSAVISDRVHILGIVDDITKHRLLATCDLLALPSQVDTFGIVFLEAWLHRKPVIGAKAGGIPDVVQHEETGLLVPFDDVGALAAAIRRLLVEPQLAAQLGDAGHQTLRHYTWDQTYHTLLSVYNTLLAGAP